MIANPKTIERNIRDLEARIEAVRTFKADPPPKYQRFEWLKESQQQLRAMKLARLQAPIG